METPKIELLVNNELGNKFHEFFPGGKISEIKKEDKVYRYVLTGWSP